MNDKETTRRMPAVDRPELAELDAVLAAATAYRRKLRPFDLPRAADLPEVLAELAASIRRVKAVTR